MLLDAKADVNAVNQNGETALMMASDTDVVRMLLDAKVDVNAMNQNGETALMRASERGNANVARMLVDAKADVNVMNQRGRTALMSASESGNATVVQVLLAAGANVNAKDENGPTARVLAWSRLHDDVVKLLDDAGASQPPTKIGILVVPPEINIPACGGSLGASRGYMCPSAGYMPQGRTVYEEHFKSRDEPGKTWIVTTSCSNPNDCCVCEVD
jgi:hypothetical protein